MISSTFGGFMIAKLGLSAAQQGLYLTGQNLTNAGTEGYTRQRLDQVSINYGATYRYASKYNVNIGNGVLVTGTSQLRDPFLDLRFRNEVSHVGEQSVKLDVLNDLRNILDEVKNAGEDSLGDGGIFNQLGDIIEKFEKYTNEIGSHEFDTMIKSSCQNLVTLFHSYSSRIDEVEETLKYDLYNVDVPRVNTILQGIQDLNKSIKNSEIIGQSALELKDHRNLLIDELASYMKINVTYKPLQVTPTTYVDELHISMVGADGTNYEIINDEQRREFVLSEKDGKTNLGLGALSPIDQELKSQLNTALVALNRAQAIYDNSPQTFMDAHNSFADAQAEMQKRQDALAAEQALLTPLEEAMKKATDAYNAEFINPDRDMDKLKELEAAQGQAVNEYNAQKAVVRAKEIEVAQYQPTYDKSQQDYEQALKNLDNNPVPTGLVDKNGDPITTSLIDGKPLDQAAGGQAKIDRDNAAERVEKALDALAQAEEAGKAVETINELLTDGRLKGELDMLNYSAEYDDPPNSIRGIGYYKSMLDTLANKFAEAMNEANNPYEFQVQATDTDGNPLYTNYDCTDGVYTFNKLIRLDTNGEPVRDANGNVVDVDGNSIYALDANGNPIYDKDKNGQVIYINVLNADGSQAYVMEPDGQGGYQVKMQDVRDANGNLVYELNADGSIKMIPMVDENGNPVMDPVYEQAQDKYGYKLVDADGNPVMVLAYEMENPPYTETKVQEPQRDADGNIVKDAAGNVIYEEKTIYTPNYVYEKDANGDVKKDSDGNPIRIVKREQAMEPQRVQEPIPLQVAAPAKVAQMTTAANGATEVHDLFKSQDGGKITAGTIDLADGWVNNTYGITTAQVAGAPSGNNDNVLHFINMLNSSLNYKADVDLLSGLEINNSGGEPSLTGMKNGDTITIDGKTYTFVAGATGQGGNEFSDLASLQAAASKNGIDITADADGKLTAMTVAKDLKALTQVNGNAIANPSDISVEKLTYGDTITIDGQTFTYKPSYPDGTDGSDADKGEFTTLEDLIDVAAARNIDIAADLNTGKITSITKTPGVNITEDKFNAAKDVVYVPGISISKDPGIQGMKDGDSITIGKNDKTGEAGKTFTFAAGADGSDGETFSDMDSLIKAAAMQGYTVYGDATSGKITTATKVGSNIFDGTFEEYYVSLDATLGLDIKSTTEKVDSYVALAGSISDEREAVTGVSHDEEAMNLMRYQQSYTAASRLMTTLDQVLEILLTQTGVVGR